MFLMYRFGMRGALVYIRRTLAGGWGGTRTDQGFYSHGRSTRGPAQRTNGQSEGPERTWAGGSDPMIEAGTPSTVPFICP